MAGYLLDTVVVSEPMRRSPNRSVIDWLKGVDEYALHLSVISLGEIRKGIQLAPDRVRRARLERWLGELHARFGERVLPIDQHVADRWGRLTASTNAHPLPAVDAQLAATALHYGLVFVTRNVGDVSRSGVALFNPWAGDV
jgi:toxin FitB